MTNSTAEQDQPIQFEFSILPGEEEVNLPSIEDLPQRSAEALNQAMGTIRTMARRTMETIDTLANKPSEVEVEFGIKIIGEAGAIISKVGGEGNITVKLKWTR
ncbi:MAG: CU044_2847 family protein [Xenococcus sp. MO_188.B8]|nr:CU044_2847 family protein [Xenococcus sp. MO_188.B8]